MVLPPDYATQDNLQCKESNAIHVLFYKPMTTPSHSYPQMPTGLPDLEPELLSHLNAHIDALRAAMQSQPEGFLPFDQFMQLCLYAPEWGYYTAGSTKFGSQTPTGDFTTGPELTPLFGQAVAQQAAQVLEQCVAAGHPPIALEFGAGTGALAAPLIQTLQIDFPTLQYWILEISPSLRARQEAHLQPYIDAGVQVRWLDQLPDSFAGCILANEVMDAMPVHWLEQTQNGVIEYGVCFDERSTGPVPFALTQRPAEKDLAHLALQRLPDIDGYRSEINLHAEGWVRALGDWLTYGAALIIDYGFPQHEYYHSQRHEGTLMCHFRHHAHDQPLIYPGLQDITAHVDFTALADAALEAQLDVYGYINQGAFLLNCGLAQQLELLHAELGAGTDEELTRQWTHIAGACQKLLSESEMGELFKVLAIGKEMQPPLLGFIRSDRRDRLAPPVA